MKLNIIPRFDLPSPVWALKLPLPRPMAYLLFCLTLIGPLFFLLLGLKLLSVAGQGLISGTESKSWPVVKGVVLKSEKKQTSEGPVADFNYKFTYDGKTYEGKSVRLWGYWSYNYVLETYPVLAEVEVFVNPSKPSNSVLEPGVPWLLVSLAFLAGGFLVLFIARWIWDCFYSDHKKGQINELAKTFDEWQYDEADEEISQLISGEAHASELSKTKALADFYNLNSAWTNVSNDAQIENHIGKVVEWTSSIAFIEVTPCGEAEIYTAADKTSLDKVIQPWVIITPQSEAEKQYLRELKENDIITYRGYLREEGADLDEFMGILDVGRLSKEDRMAHLEHIKKGFTRYLMVAPAIVITKPSEA